MNDTGCIYFLQAEKDGPVKIGKTTRPIASRIAELQTGNPTPLRLLVSVPGFTREETTIHAAFAHLRIAKTEWFTYGPDLMAFIYGAQLAGGNQDPGVDDGVRLDDLTRDQLEELAGLALERAQAADAERRAAEIADDHFDAHDAPFEHFDDWKSAPHRQLEGERTPF